MLRKRRSTLKPAAESGSTESAGERGISRASFQERPRICLIDVEDKCVEVLKGHGFNCYSGTFGSQVRVPNTLESPAHQCLLNFDLPSNLHEYDVVVVDLQNPKRVEYVQADHQHSETKGTEQIAFRSMFPETIFDPRPVAARLLDSWLRPLMNRDSILVVFAARQETVKYQLIAVTLRGIDSRNEERHSIYDFYPRLPSCENVTGEDTVVVSTVDSEITSLLKRHNRDAKYEIAFGHPTTWKDGASVKVANFIPLMRAGEDQFVAFAHIREKNLAFFFPHIKDKRAFLSDLFQRVLPGICPAVFPFSTQFVWLKDQTYRLPNEPELLQVKDQLQEEYDKKLKAVNDKIEANRKEHQFLHDLLTESGQGLVKTVEKYLTWMGFDNVVNVDETSPTLQEEDLRVKTESGLLVVEVKGIAGTSTDAECAQVSKIKYRRSEERGSFDVFGLYLVNHQRFMPPEQRMNPPFNDVQIRDAKNDKRGLLTTYDLFKLYFNVTGGYVSKEDARSSLLQTGLVTFRPSSAVMVLPPYDIHYNGYVVCFRVDGFEVRRGMSLILSESGLLRSATVLEVQVNKKPVDEVHTGDVGVKLSVPALKTTEIWLPSRRSTT